MNETDDTARWNVKHDVFRTTTEFTDLLKIVACYYEMYSKAVTFIGPYIAKQGTTFFPPDRDQLKAALGKERPAISFRARSAFVESVIRYISATKGKRTLISPNPSSHHSAQFPAGTFSIKRLDMSLALRDDKGPRQPERRGPIYKLELYGAETPVYLESLMIPPEQIQFLILRPKLGKLGTPSTSRWEVLLYKKPMGYLVEHVDSDLNPRWSGIL